MKPQEKEQLLSKKTGKYRIMEPQRKEQFLKNVKQKYDEMEPIAMRQKITKQKERRKVSASKAHDLEHYLTQFKQKNRKGLLCVFSM